LKAIIPVAGVGSRLRPHTYTLPKVLLNVAGKPILGHILDHLVESGVTSVSLIVGPMGDLIKKYVRENYDIPAEFILQAQPKGLGHAVSLGLTPEDKEVLVILGDTVFDLDLKSVIEGSKTSCIGVKEVKDPRRFGVVETKDHQVVRLVEKPEHPKSNLVIVGIYLIRDAQALRSSINLLFERELTTRGEYQLTDALQLMIERGEKMSTFPVNEWLDCGKPETMLATNRYLLDRNHIEPAAPREGCVIIPPVYIHPDAVLTRAIIGPHATIGSKAVVMDAMVKDSILGEGATVKNTLVERSLVGNNAEIKGQFLSYNVGDSSEIASV
jgi:glucose-1-phosphate thymidylyltransferase